MTNLRGLGERNSLPHLMRTVGGPPPPAELLSLPGPLVSAGELCGAGIWRPAEAGQGGGFGPIMLGLMGWGSWTFSHSAGLAARGSGEGTVGPTLQGPAVQRDQSVCKADFWPLPG